MASQGHSRGMIQAHLYGKETILKKFLQAWIPIYGKYCDLVYIDGFAGPGIYDIYDAGDSRQVEGSPLIALKVIFDHFEWCERYSKEKPSIHAVFVEADENLRAVLSQKIAELSSDRGYGSLEEHLSLHVERGNFESTFSSESDYLRNLGYDELRRFSLIDPFGYEAIPFQTVSRLLKNKFSDILVKFMTGYINKYKTNETLRGLLSDLFGGDEWKPLVDSPDEYPDAKSSEDFLVQCYENNLKQKGGAEYTLSFRMNVQNNALIYHLVYATHSVKGIKIMKEAMNRVTQEEDEFLFSDFKVQGIAMEDLVFKNQQNSSGEVVERVWQEFQGRTVKTSEIEKFVLLETEFIFRKETLKELHQRRKIKCAYILDQNGYTSWNFYKGTFPDRGCCQCVVEFMTDGVEFHFDTALNLCKDQYAGSKKCEDGELFTIKDMNDVLKHTAADFHVNDLVSWAESEGLVEIGNPSGNGDQNAYDDHYTVTFL